MQELDYFAWNTEALLSLESAKQMTEKALEIGAPFALAARRYGSALGGGVRLPSVGPSLKDHCPAPRAQDSLMRYLLRAQFVRIQNRTVPTVVSYSGLSQWLSLPGNSPLRSRLLRAPE